MSIRLLQLAVLVTLVSVGCSAGKVATPPPTTVVASSTTNFSGTALFESMDHKANHSLDMGTNPELPIQDAVVEIRNASGLLYVLPDGTPLRTNTAANGQFTVLVPQNTTVLVVVKAVLSEGNLASPAVRVVDNADGGAQHGMVASLTVTTTAPSTVLVAINGSDGTNFTGPRVAAPFAVADVVRRCRALVRSAAAGADLGTQVVNWSESNYPSAGVNVATGAIGTSHFDPATKQMYLLGKANADIDEYDTHVIAHEWFHWFQDRLSRDDSLGGSHGTGDLLDESVAFSEGTANAFSGMPFNNPLYEDAYGTNQASGSFLNVEADSISDAAVVGGADTRKLDGRWSEISVQEVVWDLYDDASSIDGVPGDDDALAYGFTPLYQVLVGGVRSTNAYISILPFLAALKAAHPGDLSAINAIAAAENIPTIHDHFDAATGEQRYTPVPTTGATVALDANGVTLSTHSTYTSIGDDPPGNKLYNRALLRITGTTAGANVYTVTVTPVITSRHLLFSHPGEDWQYYPSNPTGPIDVPVIITGSATAAFAIGSLDDDTAFTVRVTWIAPVGPG